MSHKSVKAWDSCDNQTSADVIVPLLEKYLPINSVIDFGCATGIWLNSFKASALKGGGKK